MDLSSIESLSGAGAGINFVIEGLGAATVGSLTTQLANTQLMLRDGGMLSGEVFEILDSAIISGAGTIVGNVVNNGTVAPSGQLTIDGDYTQSGSGALQIDVSGFASDEFDTLVVTDNLVLNGSLVVVVADGFMPSTSDPILSFVNFATLSGEFSFSELAGYELQSTATSLTLAFADTPMGLSAASFDDERDDVFAEAEFFETDFDELIEVSI